LSGWLLGRWLLLLGVGLGRLLRLGLRFGLWGGRFLGIVFFLVSDDDLDFGVVV